MNELMLKNTDFQKSLVSQNVNYANCAQSTTVLYFQNNQSYIWKRIKHGFSKRVARHCETHKITKKEQIQDFIYDYMKKLIEWLEKGGACAQSKELKQQVAGLKNELKRINKLSVQNEGRVERRNEKIAKMQKNIQNFLQRFNQSGKIQIHNNNDNKFKNKSKSYQAKYFQCKKLLQQVISKFIQILPSNQNNVLNLIQKIVEPKIKQLNTIKQLNQRYIQIIKKLCYQFSQKQKQNQQIKNQQKLKEIIQTKIQNKIKFENMLKIMVSKILYYKKKYQNIKILTKQFKQKHEKHQKNLFQLLEAALIQSQDYKSQIGKRNTQYEQLQKQFIRLQQNFQRNSDIYKIIQTESNKKFGQQKELLNNELNKLKYINMELIKQLENNNIKNQLLNKYNEQKQKQNQSKIQQLNNLIAIKQNQIKKMKQRLISFEKKNKQLELYKNLKQDSLQEIEKRITLLLVNIKNKEEQNSKLNKVIISLQEIQLQKEEKINSLNVRIQQYENKFMALQDKICQLTVQIEHETQKWQRQCKNSNIMITDDTDTSAQTFLSKQFVSPFYQKHQKNVAIRSYTDYIQICNKNKLDYSILYQLTLNSQILKEQKQLQTESIQLREVRELLSMGTQIEITKNEKEIQTCLYEINQKGIQTQQTQQSQQSLSQMDYIQQMDRGTQYNLNDIISTIFTINTVMQVNIQDISNRKNYLCSYTQTNQQQQKQFSMKNTEFSTKQQSFTQTDDQTICQQQNLLAYVLHQKQLYYSQKCTLFQQISEMKDKLTICQGNTKVFQQNMRKLKIYNNQIESQLIEWKRRFMTSMEKQNCQNRSLKQEKQKIIIQKIEILQCIEKLKKQNEQIKSYNLQLLQTIQYANSLFCGSASKVMKNTKKDKDISALIKGSPKKIIQQCIQHKQQQNQLNEIQSVTQNMNINQKLQQLNQEATFITEKTDKPNFWDPGHGYENQNEVMPQQTCGLYNQYNDKQIQQAYRKHLDTNGSAVKRLLADFVSTQNKQNNKLAAFETLVQMLQPNSQESEKFENFIKSRKFKNGLLQQNNSLQSEISIGKADLKQKLFRFLTQH